MTSLFSKTLAGMLAVLSLSACSGIRSLTMPDEENLLSGAGSMLVSGKSGEPGKAESFEQINLVDLRKEYGFEDFKSDAIASSTNAAKYQYLRNELQDRIIAASNQRCGAYLRTLVSSKAQTQVGWGGLSTLLSGAASVVSPASTAKALAAGSTVSNGVLSLYNEAYFNNLAINVISAGITRQRQALLEQLTGKRDASLTIYPVNRAIGDALAYHAACNIISGLETAVGATKTAATAAVLNTEPSGAADPGKSKAQGKPDAENGGKKQ